MTDAPRPLASDSDVVVELDRPRRLRLDMYAFRRFEQVTGESPFVADVLTRLETDVILLTTLLWAAMLADDPDLDTANPEEGINRVARLINFPDLPHVLLAVRRLYELALPGPDEDEAESSDPLPATSRRTGSRSGVAPASTSASPRTSSGG